MPEIIDAHVHIFPDHIADKAVAQLGELYNAQPVRRPTLDELVAEMDASGVSRAVFAPVSTRPEQVTSINAFALGLVEHPRMIPFGTLHPHFADVPGEIERLIAGGIRGVKLQPFFQGYDFADARTREMLAAIGDRLVVLMHGGQEIVTIDPVIPHAAALAGLLADFPRLRMIVAHMGGYEMWEDVAEHLVGTDVYFDLSYTFDRATDELIADICTRHGWERIVFGSDFPWMSQSQALAGLRRLGLDEATFAAVVSGNLLRLLDQGR